MSRETKPDKWLILFSLTICLHGWQPCKTAKNINSNWRRKKVKDIKITGMEADGLNNLYKGNKILGYKWTDIQIV